MKVSEAREIGRTAREHIRRSEPRLALNHLLPVVQARTPFRMLSEIGQELAAPQHGCTKTFLDMLAETHAEGAWVVIASALKQQLPQDSPNAFAATRDYVVRADIWYAADIFAERVPGPALRMDFHRALALLSPWRGDDNPWIPRMVGVAAHYWAKRSGADDRRPDHAREILAFLEPCFSEWDLPAAKGIAWGLKTLGRNYPQETGDWLCRQLGRRHRTLMRHKALTYLPLDLREAVERSMGA